MAKDIAVLWDLDGVIVDTSAYHFRSWVNAFDREGIKFTRDHFSRAFGMANIDIIPMVLGKPVPAERIRDIGDYKEANFRSLIKGHIKALPGAGNLLAELYRAGVKLALVSSTPLENIDLILFTLDLKKYFPVVVSGDDITAGKPDPQGYLLGAKKLGVAPGRCLVIEDAIVGIEAAKAGGMRCIAVTTSHSREALQAADLVVRSLREVNFNVIINLLDDKE